MHKIRIALILMLVTGCSVIIMRAQGEQQNGVRKNVTITGEIIDVRCYLSGMMDENPDAHKECALDCIKGNLPVGILEKETKAVYIVVPKGGMKGGNEELAQYAAHEVKLTGTIIKKGGESLFVYSKVEPVQ